MNDTKIPNDVDINQSDVNQKQPRRTVSGVSQHSTIVDAHSIADGEIDKLLLEVRSDQYGDSGNYNTEKLKQAIERWCQRRERDLLYKVTGDLYEIADGEETSKQVWGRHRKYLDMLSRLLASQNKLTRDGGK